MNKTNGNFLAIISTFFMLAGGSLLACDFDNDCQQGFYCDLAGICRPIGKSLRNEAELKVILKTVSCDGTQSPVSRDSGKLSEDFSANVLKN